MNKAISNWRLIPIGVLFFFLVIFLFSTPTENCSITKFFISLLWTKALAVLLGYAIFKLWSYWSKKGELKDVEEWIDQDE